MAARNIPIQKSSAEMLTINIRLADGILWTFPPPNSSISISLQQVDSQSSYNIFICYLDIVGLLYLKSLKSLYDCSHLNFHSVYLSKHNSSNSFKFSKRTMEQNCDHNFIYHLDLYDSAMKPENRSVCSSTKNHAYSTTVATARYRFM